MIKLSTLLIFIFLLSACDGNRQLKVNDELTVQERNSWRQALNFPKYCVNGKYEFDDKESPLIYFIQDNKGQTLVYNVCERYAYQDLVNIFTFDGKKPRLISFPIIELDESTVQYTDDKGNTLKHPKGEFKIKNSNLVLQRGIKILPNGYLNVIRHYSGTGTCGTLTTYDITNSKAKVIKLHAQINCDSSQHDMKQWPSYQLKCLNNPTSDCKVEKS